MFNPHSEVSTQHFVSSPQKLKCELRDVIHSLTPVLMGLGFLL